MLFSEKPDKYFPYTLVEIVHFPKGASDKEFTEKRIDGPIQQQITDSLGWLRNNILQEKVLKIPGQAEALRTWNYPYTALEEAIANCQFHRNYQIREPVEIRIESDFILLYNSGGPDRSIKREDFAVGPVLPKRYRNRRLGDFLKELKLTEAHATGLPALRKAMQLNGSPEPVFDFDDERTWFQVMLPIHPNFIQRQPLVVDLNGVTWDIIGIDRLLNEILDKAGTTQMKGKAGDQACTIAGVIALDVHSIGNELDMFIDQVNSTIVGAIAGNQISNQVSNQADLLQNIDNQVLEIVGLILGNQVSTIASGIASGLAGNQIEVLKQCVNANIKEIILSAIKLSNQRKNYVEYVKPLVDINWITMTIPNKPTSPKQQYLTTLKGRLILEFLKHKTK